MRLVLVGNYGVGNLGDEALKEYFLNTFPEVEWVVVEEGIKGNQPSPRLRLASKGNKVCRLPFGLRSLLLSPWWRTVRSYWNCDGVVFGGGSLFTDSESVKAPILWGWHALIAWTFRKPFYLAFQGVGPFRTRLGEWWCRWVVRHARFVSVRDRDSYERVKKWRGDVVLSFDPVFLEATKATKDVLLVIPRNNSDASFCERAREIYEHRTFNSVKICSLQPSDPHEQAVCRKLETLFHPYTSIRVYGYSDLVREVGSASFVLSQRYHGALAALAAGVPFEVMPQVPGDKLSSLISVKREDALRLVQDGEDALRKAIFGV